MLKRVHGAGEAICRSSKLGPFRGVGGQFLDRHVERNIGQHQISAWIVSFEVNY
jgi:hypothetical protein